MPTGRNVKIKGEYILSRRSIVRMIATITAALMSLYAAATAHDESIVHRIHDATIGLVLLDRQMVGGTAYAVVPEIMYREYKALYLTLRRDHHGSAGRLAPPVDCGGFTEADRAMLRKVYRAAVFGEMPTDAQIAGDVRRRQAIYGASLYKPSSKHVKGVSFAAAAKRAILAQEFKGVDGAYTMSERKNLARAIERVYYKKPSCDKS